MMSAPRSLHLCSFMSPRLVHLSALTRVSGLIDLLSTKLFRGIYCLYNLASLDARVCTLRLKPLGPRSIKHLNRCIIGACNAIEALAS